MNLSARLKEVRKKANANQTSFATELGSTRSAYAKYESGDVVPADTFILYLCDKHNINEKWLRTGEGEMYNKTFLDAEDNELKRIVIDVTMNDRKEVKEGMLLFANLDDHQKKLMIEVMRQMKKEVSDN